MMQAAKARNLPFKPPMLLLLLQACSRFPLFRGPVTANCNICKHSTTAVRLSLLKSEVQVQRAAPLIWS